jgi:hypothetical protein
LKVESRKLKSQYQTLKAEKQRLVVGYYFLLSAFPISILDLLLSALHPPPTAQ